MRPVAVSRCFVGPCSQRKGSENQWCSGKFRVGGTLRGLGAEPPAGSRGERFVQSSIEFRALTK